MFVLKQYIFTIKKCIGKKYVFSTK